MEKMTKTIYKNNCYEVICPNCSASIRVYPSVLKSEEPIKISCETCHNMIWGQVTTK